MKLPLPILSNRLYWLVRLRWIACAGVFAVVWLTSEVLDVVSNPVELYIITFGMAGYNFTFAILIRKRIPVGVHLDRNIILQMTLDQIALILLLYYSGTCYNPFIYYFVFHMTIAALLLHGWAPYGLAGLASVLVCLVMIGQYTRLLPIHALNYSDSAGWGGEINKLYLVGFLAAFCSTLWITVYFASSIHRYMHRAEAVMRQKEKMLGISQLVAGISHQINNPLDGIQNCLRTIGKGVKDDEHLSRYVGLMTEALQRIERTAKRVQSFSRPHGLDLGPTDLNIAIEAAVALLGNGSDRGVTVITDLKEIPQVTGDFYTLQEVLFNLCTNAFAAMEDGGTITIRTFLTGPDRFGTRPNIAVEVIDTGCGIPAENIDRIFEPFFTTRSSSGGTGLGLALCRMLISEMGGRIEVDSEPDNGSTFRIILNIHQGDMESREAAI